MLQEVSADASAGRSGVGPECEGGGGAAAAQEPGAGQPRPRHGLRLQRRQEQEERPAGGQGEARYVVAEIRELKNIILFPFEGDPETAFAHQEAAAAATSIQGEGEGQDIQEAGPLHGRRQDELLQVGVCYLLEHLVSFFMVSF